MMLRAPQCHLVDDGVRRRTPAVLLHAVAQRIEVERLQRAFRFHLVAVVRDEQFAIDEPNIGFHAAKPAFERVE